MFITKFVNCFWNVHMGQCVVGAGAKGQCEWYLRVQIYLTKWKHHWYRRKWKSIIIIWNCWYNNDIYACKYESYEYIYKCSPNLPQALTSGASPKVWKYLFITVIY